MRCIQLFRKIDPAEWGGTETAMKRLFDGLRQQGVESVIFCPKLSGDVVDPFMESGYRVERFKAFVPVLGMSRERKRQLVAVGGNLMSFGLITSLSREQDIHLIHSHALGRIGAIGRTMARRRGIPFVVTVHGGVLDLPPGIKAAFNAPNGQGFDWGRLFGLLFQSHRLLADADAVLTCNQREASLLQERYPGKRVICQPHGVEVGLYQQDHRQEAVAAWPRIAGRKILLSLGRIDPIKNQGWLLDQAPGIFHRHPEALIVLAGACTDEPYGRLIDEKIQTGGLADRVILTGGMASSDPGLIGLLQSASTLILPSLSETFGLVLLEAWAAGTMVMSSCTSGGQGMIEHGHDGWLFDLENPATFHEALDRILSDPPRRAEMISRGAQKARMHYSVEAVARQVRALYDDLIEEKQCAT